MRRLSRVLVGFVPFALSALTAAGCSSGSGGDTSGDSVAISTTSLGYVAQVNDATGALAVHLDVQNLASVQHAHVHWAGGDMTLDAYVTQVGLFPDGLSLGYAGTVTGASGAEEFDVAPRSTVTTAHYSVQAGPGEVVVTETASGAVLSMASTNGVPQLPWVADPNDTGYYGNPAYANASASAADGADAGAGSDAGSGAEPEQLTHVLDETTAPSDSSRVRFASSSSPCLAVNSTSNGAATTNVAANGAPVQPTSNLVSTSLRPEALVTGQPGSLTSGGAPLVAGSTPLTSSGCGEPLTQPTCSTATIMSGNCLVASNQNQCTLSSIGAAAASCGVAALATTEICAAGTLVTTLGTGEALCLVPGAATLACGIAALFTNGVAKLVCGSSTRTVQQPQPADPGDCDQDTQQSMQTTVNYYCKQLPPNGGCTTQSIDGQTPTCQLISQAISKWSNCATWRTKINDKCYQGGDPEHKQALASAKGAVQNCVSVFQALGCPSS